MQHLEFSSSTNKQVPLLSRETHLLPSSGSARPLGVPAAPRRGDPAANPAGRRGDGQTHQPAPHSRTRRRGHQPSTWASGQDEGRAGAAPSRAPLGAAGSPHSAGRPSRPLPASAGWRGGRASGGRSRRATRRLG